MPGNREHWDAETTDVTDGQVASEELCLVIVNESAVTVQRLPSAGRITIGRAPDNTIQIENHSISRHHAAIEIGQPLRIQDLGGVNGVRLRLRKLAAKERAEIALGDVVELGLITLIVQHRSAAHRLAASPMTARGQTNRAPGAGRPAVPVVVDDPVMQRLHALVERVADSEISVLLLGETGVGKELLAEAIHAASPRAGKAMVRLNCAALSPALLESELFGHERGAFTGASQAKPGLLETAPGGTVFLDEVGELPPAVQVKLLRVLEERAVQRVGALAPVRIDVRFVAATNRDLKTQVELGNFRQDLFFRLNGISIMIPPLRERVGDIPGLVKTFLARAATSSRRSLPTVSEAAMAKLTAYAWPGNVREIRNVIERAVVLCSTGIIEAEHLPPEIGVPAEIARPVSARERSDAGTASRSLKDEMADLERRRILAALEKCGGNQSRAAEVLGMPRRTLVTRLQEYGVPRPLKR